LTYTALNLLRADGDDDDDERNLHFMFVRACVHACDVHRYIPLSRLSSAKHPVNASTSMVALFSEAHTPMVEKYAAFQRVEVLGGGKCYLAKFKIAINEPPRIDNHQPIQPLRKT
jgi:hypothetical protein